MTEQGQINNEVQTKLFIHDEKFNSTMARVDATNEKIDNLITEMRDKDSQRQAEISEMRQAFQSLQNQNVVVMIGVIAIAVAVFLK